MISRNTQAQNPLLKRFLNSKLLMISAFVAGALQIGMGICGYEGVRDTGKSWVTTRGWLRAAIGKEAAGRSATIFVSEGATGNERFTKIVSGVLTLCLGTWVWRRRQRIFQADSESQLISAGSGVECVSTTSMPPNSEPPLPNKQVPSVRSDSGPNVSTPDQLQGLTLSVSDQFSGLSNSTAYVSPNIEPEHAKNAMPTLQELLMHPKSYASSIPQRGGKARTAQ